MSDKDVQLFKELQKSPILFISKMWNLSPQTKGEPFVKGKHITFQQVEILHAVELALTGGKPKRISIASGHGIGKAHPKDLMIDTPDGKKMMWGDLVVGDKLLTPTGTTKITDVMQQGEMDIYKITFDDGSCTYSTKQHLWTVKGRQQRRKKEDYITKELQELVGAGIKRSNGVTNARQFELPPIFPVEMEYKMNNIEPYLLGVWLGDGCRKSGKIVSDDKEVTDRIKELGYNYSTYDDLHYNILGLQTLLKEIDIFDKYSYQKSIPDRYKYTDSEGRLELLRGLLDTDGYVDKRGSVIYSTTSKELADDICWLVRSLAGKASIQPTVKKPFYYKDGEKIMGRDCYNVTIRFSYKQKLFYIKRKQDRLKAESQTRYSKRWIDGVELVGKKDCMCVSIEAEDGLYLANDFIPTHNSATISWLMLWYLFCFKDCQIACTAPSAEQMNDVLWKEAAKWIALLPEGVKEKYEWTGNHIRITESPETWFARAKTARKEAPEALAGVHAENVMLLVDEASGVPEEIFNTAEGSLTEENTLVILISNPTRLIGYFYDSQHGDKENWQTMSFSSIESPIVDHEYVKRIRDKHGEDSDEYRIRVLGQFPNEESADDRGFLPLFSRGEIQLVQDNHEFRSSDGGQTRLMIDPAGEGRDKTVWCIRDRFVLKKIAEEKISTPIEVAKRTEDYMDRYGIAPENVFIDGFGIGAKVAVEIASHNDYGRINVVLTSDKADDSDTYLNVRAESAFRMRKWLKEGGQIVENRAWEELFFIRYKRNLQGRVQIMDKTTMKKLLNASPDNFDSASLGFVRVDGAKKTTRQIRQNWQGYGRIKDNNTNLLK